jgi:hypothetical protein
MGLLYKVSGINDNNEKWEFIGYSKFNDIDLVKKQWISKVNNATINQFTDTSILTKIWLSGIDNCIFEIVILDLNCYNETTLKTRYIKQQIQEYKKLIQ